MARERLKADDSEASLLDRRSYLKMAGTAAAAVVSGSSSAAAADSTVGYGEGQYGIVPYGGGQGGSAPTINKFNVTKSEQLGDDRMFSVQWAASDSDDDLDMVEVVVHQGTADMNFAVENVSGNSASGWNLFQFPIGSSVDVTLRVTDENDHVVKDSKTISL